MTENMVVASAVRRSTIELYALFGSFRLRHSPYTIRYASTFANSAEPGHRELLRELKPMRDRVAASQLRDLSSLLQRDLNDARVATELIPYLCGERTDVGFFPAILAVLIPKGYLNGDAGAVYPRPDAISPTKTQYGEAWGTERFHTGASGAGKVLPMGILRVVPSEAEVVVLDGQHRGNAFRYLSGDFEPASTIHQVFYDGVSDAAPLAADLPVTLVWFETDPEHQVDPKLISRKLFVDVNNSARPVSQTRTILLDDRSVTAIGTQTVYAAAAARGFVTDRLSLLHSAFDMDSDLAQGRLHPLLLTSPEIVDDALGWALLGTNSYDNLTAWVARQKLQKNSGRLAQIVDRGYTLRSADDERGGLAFANTGEAHLARAALEERYTPLVLQMFDENALIAPHFAAGTQLAAWVDAEGDTTTREVWDRVFRGGEGLYWSFGRAGNQGRARGYQIAIRQIEDRFTELRAEAFGADASRAEVDQVYESIASKAFQTGYLMAVDFLARAGEAEGDYLGAGSALVARLNQVTPAQWRVLLIDFRRLLIPSVTPRSWPAYRTLLVRLFDGERGQHFSDATPHAQPEHYAYTNALMELADAIGSVVDAMPSEQKLLAAARTAREDVLDVVTRAGLGPRWLSSGAAIEYGRAYLRDRLAKTFGEVPG